MIELLTPIFISGIYHPPPSVPPWFNYELCYLLYIENKLLALSHLISVPMSLNLEGPKFCQSLLLWPASLFNAGNVILPWTALLCFTWLSLLLDYKPHLQLRDRNSKSDHHNMALPWPIVTFRTPGPDAMTQWLISSFRPTSRYVGSLILVVSCWPSCNMSAASV